jgi:N-acetylmuramoyl-L-alanine amidase
VGIVVGPLLGLLAAVTPGAPAYPERGAELVHLETAFPKRFGKKRIYLDAGHGTTANEGATTALCDKEQDVVLAIANALKIALESTGRFDVRLSRTTSVGPSYEDRVRTAERFHADALISLHLDARGEADTLSRPKGQIAFRNDAESGFGILRSDRGSSSIVARRRDLARALARRMMEVGFPAYDGEDYGGLYTNDPVPGVFIDRRSLFMLRRPRIPSVIIETHHGLYLNETERWREPATLTAFGEAVSAALVDFLRRS